MVDRETLPDLLTIEAKNAHGLIMGIPHLTLPIYGIQFHHDSILTPMAEQLIWNFLKQCVHTCNHSRD